MYNNLGYVFLDEGEKVAAEKLNNPSGQWGLKSGIHAGTANSADDAEPPEWGFQSFEECRKKLEELIPQYHAMGYRLWFAYAIAPDGTRHQLTHEMPYNRV
jgi:hypothetical protein